MMTTTLGQFWFNLFLLNLCIFISFRHAKKNRFSKTAWLLMLIFCLFAFWDIDYFGLYDAFQGMTNNNYEFRDLLYPWLTKISFGSYTLFRFYIWGAAEYLLYKTTRLLGLNPNLTIYVMIMNFLLLFSYARASLGMILYFYGITYYVVSPNKRKFWVMLICFLLSFFSHRTMLILVAMTPLFFVKLKKTRLFVIALFFLLVMIPLSRYIVLNMAEVEVDETESLLSSFNQSVQSYSRLGVSYTFEDNWKYSLIKSLRNLSIYLGIAFSLIIILCGNKMRYISPYMKQLLMLTIGIALTGAAFLVQGTFGSEIIGYRILYMAGIPVVLLLSYLAQNHYCSWRTLHFAFLPSLLFQEGFIIGKIISLGIY